jgi:hypothetical protein
MGRFGMMILNSLLVFIEKTDQKLECQNILPHIVERLKNYKDIQINKLWANGPFLFAQIIYCIQTFKKYSKKL